MITLRADPGHPHGGYAELSLPADKVSGDTVELAVFDKYSERYLGGDGWQATREAFGPYAVQRDGATARVLIGPEIVNQIEEYANVRLELGDVTQDIGWPDDIVPAPGAARIGNILSARAPQAGGGAGLDVRLAPPAEPDPPEAAPDPEEDIPPPPDPVDEPGDVPEESDESEQEDDPRRRSGAWLWLVALVLVALGGGWWYLQEGARPVTTDNTGDAPAQTGAVSDTCALDTIAAEDGFAAQLDALRDCGADASADTALTLLERAANRQDAGALLLFGEIYDAEAGDPVIEETIGLSLPDTPATAADYYSRAVEAGSDTARERLGALCTRLETMSDTLARSAFADHCGS
ncbi:MAG: hypothetical protein U5K36_11575 [Roseovarius sp.]|nr:hypothetical protein [Roseovarius sp.]